MKIIYCRKKFSDSSAIKLAPAAGAVKDAAAGAVKGTHTLAAHSDASSLVPHQKNFHTSHRIFGHMHRILNVNKKIN